MAILTGAGEKSFVAGAAAPPWRRKRRSAAASWRAADSMYSTSSRTSASRPLPRLMATRSAADASWPSRTIGLPSIPHESDSRRSISGRLPDTVVRSGVARGCISAAARHSNCCSPAIRFSAADAYRLRLVNRVVTAANLMGEARKLAHTLASKAPVAVPRSRPPSNRGLETAARRGAKFRGHALRTWWLPLTTCAKEPKAFLEKRKAEFRGK